MPELIDRDALLSDIKKETEFFSSSPGNHSFFDYAKKNGLIIARHIIERQPTIEAEPVRHGRWYEFQCFSEHGIQMASYECTNCGNDIERQRGVLPAYCEFCGARMDLRTPTEAALDIADSVMMGGADNG